MFEFKILSFKFYESSVQLSNSFFLICFELYNCNTVGLKFVKFYGFTL